MRKFKMGREVVKAERKRKAQGKPKRLARQSDRDIAAELARAYRSQLPYVWKPDEADGGVMRKVPIDGADLARMLERFAVSGTFARPTAFERLTRARVMRHIDAKLRAKGADYHARMGAIVESLGGSKTAAYQAMKDDAIAKLRDEIARHEAAITALQDSDTSLKFAK